VVQPCGFNLGTVGFLGSASRDMLRGPGLTEWDLSIVKDTKIKFPNEAAVLQFRTEIFNILNHANFGVPSGSTFSGSTADAGAYSESPLGNAGQVTNTITTSRHIQFALKLIF